MSEALERIIAEGNVDRSSNSNWLRCADGFRLSVIAGRGAYCKPRPAFDPRQRLPDALRMYDVPSDFPGPYTHVEVGYPSTRPEPWSPVGVDRWLDYVESPEDPTGTVYAQVPVDLVRSLVAAHGGVVGTGKAAS